ncbi:hypothetical protein QQP08_004162 [Theobroma cacao]|nr:hypothetical protein QQP08_004162 [Theobroma cacao]
MFIKECCSIGDVDNLHNFLAPRRYPFEEAATVAISTVKEFADDIKEVHFVLFSDQIYNVWLNKAKELLQA